MEKFKPKFGSLLVQFILLIAVVFCMTWIKDKLIGPKHKIQAPAIKFEPVEYITIDQLEEPKINAKDIEIHPVPMPEFENYQPQPEPTAE